MKKIYHLATCSTCKRLIKEWNPGKDVVLQDIKTEPMTEAQIDKMAELAGSYEALFSRRAMKFRALGLHEKALSEKDYRTYILKEYTFLKRPVVIVGESIYIGNSKKTAQEVQNVLNK